MKILRHIIIAASFIAACSTQAETPKRPALVIGITIEGLSSDYITLLEDLMTDEGFKRLKKQGLWFEQIDYGPGLDATAATAVLYTGASPAVNGIGGEKIYSKTHKAAFHVFNDPDQVGNFTSETYSPKALLVSNLTDELRIDSRGYGIAETVAPSAAEAIAMGGHAGNGTFWISDASGLWATSTWYPDMPNAVSQRNYRTPLSQRIDSMKWTPLFSPLLPGVSDQKRFSTFEHRFAKGDPDRYVMFKASALGNREITDMAIELINAQGLGRHSGMDMLNVGYTLAPYSYGKSADATIETLDAYLRLDRDIARLLKAAEAKAGRGEVAVFLGGTPAEANDKRDASEWRIPYGQFSGKKAESLLNMYLMALHGNGQWIHGYHGGHFYLNTDLIKERQLDLGAIRAESAEFLTRMAGVAEAWTIDDVIAMRIGEGEAAAIKRNTPVKSSGDIIIRTAPGWEVVDDGSQRAPVVNRLSRKAIPAAIMAPGVNARIVSERTDARVIAPTVARALWVRCPNGASLAPVSLR